VAEHWLKAYPGRLDKPKFAHQRELKKQAIMADKEKLKRYRQRLGSLSWFMSRLNEPLAKQSNSDDKVNDEVRESTLGYICTGRFWDSFFASCTKCRRF
jgi:hypothetical protein